MQMSGMNRAQILREDADGIGRFAELEQAISQLKRLDRQHEIKALKTLVRHWRLGTFEDFPESALATMRLLLAEAS